MRNTRKHLIWGNLDLNYEDWRADIEADHPGIDEADGYNLMIDINNDYLEDERMNLNIKLNSAIIAIGDIGRWNGRRNGYKLIKSGRISDCLYTDCDYAEWYVDDKGDLRQTGYHHDGTNFILYRELRPDLSDIQYNRFLDKVLDGNLTRRDLNRYTKKLGGHIQEVYGWAA